MSEHKITIVENYALLYFRIPYCTETDSYIEPPSQRDRYNLYGS